MEAVIGWILMTFIALIKICKMEECQPFSRQNINIWIGFGLYIG